MLRFNKISKDLEPWPKSLVLVVGAGASKEVNLPVGDELKDKISKRIDFRFRAGQPIGTGDQSIHDAIRAVAQKTNGTSISVNSYFDACRKIRDAMPQAASIDNFIDSHRGDPLISLCGKLAIASCILKAEANSALFVPSSHFKNKIAFGRLEDAWFNKFFRLLIENCKAEQMPERLRRVAIVTFNYDRCIEHYLHQAFQNYFRLQSAHVSELMEHLQIFHPYGSLGPLEWSTGPDSVSFGAEPQSELLIKISAQLKTFTEGTNEAASDIVEIRSTVQTAQRLAFLGFSYGQQNLDLLYGAEDPNKPQANTSVYGSAFGLSSNDVKVIGSDLRRLGRYQEHQIQLRDDLKCHELLRDYGLSLRIT